MRILGGLTRLKMFQFAERNSRFLIPHIQYFNCSSDYVISFINYTFGCDMTKYLGVVSFLLYYFRLNIQVFGDVKLCLLGELLQICSRIVVSSCTDSSSPRTLWLLYHVDEGTTLLRNIRNFTRKGKSKHLKNLNLQQRCSVELKSRIFLCYMYYPLSSVLLSVFDTILGIISYVNDTWL
jgi:hypothetical protein